MNTEPLHGSCAVQKLEPDSELKLRECVSDNGMILAENFLPLFCFLPKSAKCGES